MSFSSFMQSFASACWSVVSNMTKFLLYPSLSICFLRILTHAAWKVPTHMPSRPSPSMFSSLSFISLAALLVKVMANMDDGWTGLSLMTVQSLSCSSGVTAAPAAALCMSSISSSVKLAGTLSEWYALPYFIMYAILFTSTEVFPDPAPARTSSGPFIWKTACLCCGLSLPNSFSSSSFLNLMNSCLFASVIIRSAPCFHFIVSPIISNDLPPRNTKTNIRSRCLFIPAFDLLAIPEILLSGIPRNTADRYSLKFRPLSRICGTISKRDRPGSRALPLMYAVNPVICHCRIASCRLHQPKSMVYPNASRICSMTAKLTMKPATISVKLMIPSTSTALA